jgi:hypothetical protein
MTTLLNSPTTPDFDAYSTPFILPDPLLKAAGIDQHAMIRVLHDQCDEFAHALAKGKVEAVRYYVKTI